MNTKQIVVLWYSTVAVLIPLFDNGWGVRSLNNGSTSFAIGASIFGGLVFLTVRNGNQLDNRLFFRWIGALVFSFVALIAIIIYQREVVNNEVLPPREQALVTGNAGRDYDTSSYFSGKLYNGSNYRIHYVVFILTATEKNGDIRWVRKFSQSVNISPLKIGAFMFEIVGANGAKLDWSIGEVRGRSLNSGETKDPETKLDFSSTGTIVPPDLVQVNPK